MKKAIVVIVVALLVATSVFVYFLLTHKVWPIVFQLTNTGTTSIQVPVYLNGQANQSSPVTLLPGKPVSVTLSGTNPRTSKPYTAKQTKNLAVYLDDGQSVRYTPVKVPKASWVFAPNISGFNPESTNPGTSWNKKGYYVATFL